MTSRGTYDRRRAQGLCLYCEEKREPGRSLCAAHLERHRLRKRLSADSGLCIHCQKNEADPGMSTCVACRERARKNQADKYAKKRAAGICYQCDQPATDGRLCAAHAQKAREAARRHAEKRKWQA